MKEGQKPSHRLTFEDAIKVWHLHWDGTFQNRIAASFDTNSARINEVLKGRRHVGSREVALRLYKKKSE